jgi:hypothetical protein
MVQVVGIIPQGINRKNRVFHATHNNPHIPRKFVRRIKQGAPIKGGGANAGINKQN